MEGAKMALMKIFRPILPKKEAGTPLAIREV
jgi:hypothetical protein